MNRLSLFLRFLRHSALFGLAILLLWLGGYLAFAAWVAKMHPDDPGKATDAVIVLTGGARRVNTGLDLLANGSASKLVISGVNEAVSVRDILDLWQSNSQEKDAASCCIILDHKAQNTMQNASETREWVVRENIHSIRLVTSSYHMPRAWLEFRHVLPDIEIVPHPVVSVRGDIDRGTFWKLTFEEYHKTLLTLLRTHFWPRFRNDEEAVK